MTTYIEQMQILGIRLQCWKLNLELLEALKLKPNFAFQIAHYQLEI
jgi:hypothetical protein